MADVNSVNVSNTDYVMSGINTIISCTTAVGTATKTATVPKGFTLDSGVSFLIKFTNGNTATSPTLTLTPEGGSALTNKSLVGTSGSNVLVANVIYTCYYNGTSFLIDNNCTYHISNTSNPHSVTASQVNLGNVANRTIDATASTSSTNYIQNNVATSIANGVVCTTSGATTNAKVVNLTGFTLFNGATVRVSFQAGNILAKPTLNVNSTGAKTIVVLRNNKFYFPAVHTGYWDGATTTSTRMWDNYVTFELMYLSGSKTVYDSSNNDSASSVDGVWLIMGNPVVNSYFSTDSSYTVYANGLIEQWGGEIVDITSLKTIYFPIVFSTSNPNIKAQFVRRVDTGVPRGVFSIVNTSENEFHGEIAVSTQYTTGSYLQWKAVGY